MDTILCSLIFHQLIMIQLLLVYCQCKTKELKSIKKMYSKCVQDKDG